MADAAQRAPSGWQDDVRRFWFGELQPSAWFRRDPELDRRISGRFTGLHAALAETPAAALAADAPTALAAIVVLDQFSRNMFRRSPRAFASDALAREVARLALAARLDESLSGPERLFVYLPFEHSEDMADQDRSVALISALGDAGYTRYAVAHRDIVARFGRFPHRNGVLGRASTPAEEAFLAGPGSSF